MAEQLARSDPFEVCQRHTRRYSYHPTGTLPVSGREHTPEVFSTTKPSTYSHKDSHDCHPLGSRHIGHAGQHRSQEKILLRAVSIIGVLWPFSDTLDVLIITIHTTARSCCCRDRITIHSDEQKSWGPARVSVGPVGHHEIIVSDEVCACIFGFFARHFLFVILIFILAILVFILAILVFIFVIISRIMQGPCGI